MLAPTPSNKNNGSILHDMAGMSSVQTISEAQAKRFWAIARHELKLSESDVKSVLAGFQLERTAEIPINKYDIIIQSMKDYATKF
ncbi:MAG: hypothetical protein AB3A66_28010 (plasmid) [Nodularia sp. CChRGM 3473]